jgi:uncharacterized protein involved in exopolysaccharide biosynthesis/Mrp family chromosome partitioning ATPase
MTEQIADTNFGRSTRSLTIRDFVYVLFRHKWKMVFFFFLVVCLAVTATLVSSPIYRSEAKLLLKIGRESVSLDPTATTGPIMSVSQSRLSEINSEIEILRGRDLIEKVIDSVGCDQLLMKPQTTDGRSSSMPWLQSIKSFLRWPKDVLKRIGMSEPLSEREQILFGIVENLYVGAEKDSNIIKISYSAKSPETAQRVVSEVINLSLEKHIAAHRTPGSYEFFVEQTAHLKDKLKASEDKLKALKNKVGITSIEQQQTILLERLRLLEVERDTTKSTLASSTAKVRSLEETIAQIPETTVLQETTGYPGSGADAMREELFRLQIEEQKLLKNYGEDTRSVISIREEIARAEELLKKEQDRTQVTKGLNRSYEELSLALLTEKANQVALEMKLSFLNQQINSAQQELVPLNDVEMEIADLLRDISMQEANLRKYSENLEQARIDDAMESRRISNISIVQEATFPVKPVSPRKLLNVGLGFFVGLFGALLLAIVSEMMDHTIKSPYDIEDKMQMPSLGYIPRSRVFRLNGQSGKTMNSKAGVKRLGFSKKSNPATSLIKMPAKPQNIYIDVNERLLQSLNGSVGSGYVIGITSYSRHEGVSTIAANLARAMSDRYAGKVLVIDANTAYPSLHKILGVGLSPGLTDIIKTCSAKDAIRQIYNLRAISAGMDPDCLTDGLMWERFKHLLAESKKRYRITIIDIPAMTQGALASKIAAACDGVIMVIEAERLRWEAGQNWCKQLDARKVKPIGAVLNKRRFYIPHWIYKAL